MLIDLDQIIIPKDRIRSSYTVSKFEDLMVSIKHGGLINSIVVIENGDGKYELKAGEHRFKAVTKLNEDGSTIPNLPTGKIEAKLWKQLSRREALLLEWDENDKRDDFSPIDKAKFIRLFHETMLTESKGVWTAELTAHMLRLSTASISHYLRIEAVSRTHPEVAKAETTKAAVKRMKKIEALDRRRSDVEKAVPEAVKRAEQILHCGDARNWIQSIDSDSIDLVNFDPPWGEEASHKVAENWEGFEDTSELFWQLTESLLPQLFRVLRNDRFFIFWLRIFEAKEVIAFAKTVGFTHKYTKTPCIWYKPDKVSDQQRYPEKTLLDAYETFILLRKGDPVLHEQGSQNVFVEPRVVMSQTMHPTEKPVPLMHRLLKLTSGPGETILDPCAGSSSILEAAIANFRRAKGCELSPKYHARGVTRLAEILAKFSEGK